MKVAKHNRITSIIILVAFAIAFGMSAFYLNVQEVHGWGESKNAIFYYLKKVDENGNPVPGATFTFDAKLDFNGKVQDTYWTPIEGGPNEIIDSWTSTDENNGIASLETTGDDPTTLIISESVTPEGYETAADVVIKFRLTARGWVGTINGEPYTGLDNPTITIVNKLKKHEVKIAKRTEAGELLEGAELEITGTVFNGDALDPVTITDTSQVSTQNLPAGEYTLKETTVPKGYLKADDITFKVDHDGNVTVNGEQVGEVVMTDIKEKTPRLSVKKTSNVKNASPGDVIPYVITVTNKGDGDADDVIVLDTMGNNLTYVSDDSNGEHDGQKVSWHVNVPAGETKTININCRINEDAIGKIINNVVITNVESEYIEPDEGDDSFVLGISEDKKKEEEDGDKTAETKDDAHPGIVSMFGLAALALSSLIIFRRRRVQN